MDTYGQLALRSRRMIRHVSSTSSKSEDHTKDRRSDRVEHLQLLSRRISTESKGAREIVGISN